MDLCVKTSLSDTIQRGFESIPDFARELLELPLHPGQVQCANNMKNKKEIAIHSGNRWGKGDLIKVFGTWIAMYKPVAPQFKNTQIPILNTSITQDQANIVFDKFMTTIAEKPKIAWAIKKVSRNPFPCIYFKTGVEWWFRNASQNGKFLEGRSYYWANFDEADLQDDFHYFMDNILLPRVWDFGGPVSWTTTPRRGKRNAFKRILHLQAKIKAGNKSIMVHQGDSRENTFLHPDTLLAMETLPARLFTKNVLGVFEDSTGAVSHETIQNARLIASGLIQGAPKHRGFFINAWDLARKSTFNVGVTIETCRPLQLVSWERTQDTQKNNQTYWKTIAKKITERHERFPGLTVIDGTGIGDVLNSFLDISPRVVLVFNTNTKKTIIESGLASLEAAQIGIPFDHIHQTINGEYWSAEDELLDFDPETCNNVDWDFVCAVFMALAIHKNVVGSNVINNSPPVPPIVTGQQRYAYI